MAWAPDYVTTAELKAFVRITDSVDDAQLALAISAASRAIDRYTNRQFGRVASLEERSYSANWDRRQCRWVVIFDDVMSASGFSVEVEAGLIDVYDLKPANAAQVSRPWTYLVVDPSSTNHPLGRKPDEVTITGLWGWTAVPDPIKEATLLQASRLFARRNSPYGVAGSPDLGSELRLLAKVDPDVAVALGPYIRWWTAP